MHLHTTSQGEGHETVFVHGFTQTGASWAPVQRLVVDRGRRTVVDLPGHGGSGAVEASLWETADLLADVPQVPPATWVGYSLGARCCLHLALARPEQVDRLVLIGATAGIEDDGERAARVERDEALADHIVHVGVGAFLEEWLAQPLFAGLDGDPEGRAARAANTAPGLASSLRTAGTGTQDPLWDRLGEITVPVLLVAGERDERFVANAQRMAGLLPDAAVAVIPGATHPAHLEHPLTFVTAWQGWERSLAARGDAPTG